MAITDVRTANPFGVLSPRWVDDPRLSYAALGIIAWLMSFEPGKPLDVEALVERGRGRQSGIKLAVRELLRAGYLVDDDETGGLVLVALDCPFLPAPRQGDRA
ncbi:hypothetical protein [Nonomuraea rubra]|uniref:hypothetical protein n=1 Tax=Nonomuraea rubra TaxID=46180 RepID=UPI0034017835